jgi:hypothetical protein
MDALLSFIPTVVFTMTVRVFTRGHVCSRDDVPVEGAEEDKW